MTGINIDSNGFTLMEILISLAILSIGILGVASMQISSIKGNISARKVTSNVSWAGNRVINMITTNYKSLGNGKYIPQQSNDGIDNNSNGEIDEQDETGNISIEWTIAEDRPVENTKTVRATVTQTGPGGRKAITLIQVIPEII